VKLSNHIGVSHPTYGAGSDAIFTARIAIEARWFLSWMSRLAPFALDPSQTWFCVLAELARTARLAGFSAALGATPPCGGQVRGGPWRMRSRMAASGQGPLQFHPNGHGLMSSNHQVAPADTYASTIAISPALSVPDV
jgi:hypothetical protein